MLGGTAPSAEAADDPCSGARPGAPYDTKTFYQWGYTPVILDNGGFRWYNPDPPEGMQRYHGSATTSSACIRQVREVASTPSSNLIRTGEWDSQTGWVFAPAHYEIPISDKTNERCINGGGTIYDSNPSVELGTKIFVCYGDVVHTPYEREDGTVGVRQLPTDCGTGDWHYVSSERVQETDRWGVLADYVIKTYEYRDKCGNVIHTLTLKQRESDWWTL